MLGVLSVDIVTLGYCLLTLLRWVYCLFTGV
jgi:hypothetical protein